MCGNTSNGAIDIYVTKIDSLGNTLWTQIIGIDSAIAVCNQIKNTKDGGHIIVGYDQIGNVMDVLLMKIDSLGSVQWVKTYGGIDSDNGENVFETSDGGYIVVGGTFSFGAAGYGDAYLLKTDSAGNLLWSKIYGGAGKEWGCSVKETNDGGYVFAGVTWITNGAFLIKTDQNGGVDCFENSPATIVNTPGTHTYTASFIVGQCNASNTPNTIVGSVGVEENICNYTNVQGIDYSDNALEIYPNPASKNFIIETLENGTLEIFNIEGQLVKTIYLSAPKTSVDVSYLPNGVYAIEVKSAKGVVVKKLIKQ
ncbi:MAG: hypothetical protein BWY70_01557 [Bacteroidetes bacterium ADurb.Bin408]|nr:MAG: hypothetical protein BWY70_01557 [Bacteroidetes bacterium ADurb.Bin408]